MNAVLIKSKKRPTKRAARYYLTIFLAERIRQVREMGRVSPIGDESQTVSHLSPKHCPFYATLALGNSQ
jgi:hypothetical protein